MIVVQSWLLNKRKRATTADLAVGNGGPTVVYDVPFVAQKHINMCGEACVKMLKEFKGRPVAIDMGINPRGVFQGKKFDKLAADHGLTEGYFPGQLDNGQWTKGAITAQSIVDALTSHGPIICSGDFCRMMGSRWGHYVLVTGVQGGLIHFNDPWHGDKRKKPVDWFIDMLGSLYVEKQKTWMKNGWGTFPGYPYMYVV